MASVIRVNTINSRSGLSTVTFDNSGAGVEVAGIVTATSVVSSGILKVSGAGSNSILVGSTDASGVSIGLDGDSNGDGSGSDYALLQHTNAGELKILNDNPSGSGPIIFGTPSEKLRIDDVGRTLIGHNASLSEGCLLQVARANDNTVELFGYSANANGARINFTKSRNGTIGINTIVQDGDTLGELHFRAANGVDQYYRAAAIEAEIDGGVGISSLPGRLIFSTTAPGATTQTERLRIASTGRVAIGNATNNASPTALFGVKADDGEAADLYVGQFDNLEATAGQSYGVAIRAGSNSTDHGFRVKNRANDTTQFLVRGDGNIGIKIAEPKSNLHVYAPGDIRMGSLYGGVAMIALQVQYDSGYTGTHFIFEITDQASYSFEGSHIVHGSGGSSYGTEVTVVRMQASREAGATDSGDTWRNGTVKYNNNFTAHDQVGLNPGAGTFSFTYDDAATTTTSQQKMSFSASGQGVGVWAKLNGIFTWASASQNGYVKIKDKDGNVLWESNP